MKAQLKSMLLMIAASLLVFTGCKKGDHPHSVPTAQLLRYVAATPKLGSTVGPDRALYVTAPLAGSIWRVNPNTGAVTLFTTGLPKRNPDPFFQGAGVIDVAFRGGTAYALVTGVATDLGGQDIVGIYRVDGPDSYTIMADLGAWSVAHPGAGLLRAHRLSVPRSNPTATVSLSLMGTITAYFMSPSTARSLS